MYFIKICKKTTNNIISQHPLGYRGNCKYGVASSVIFLYFEEARIYNILYWSVIYHRLFEILYSIYQDFLCRKEGKFRTTVSLISRSGKICVGRRSSINNRITWADSAPVNPCTLPVVCSFPWSAVQCSGTHTRTFWEEQGSDFVVLIWSSVLCEKIGNWILYRLVFSPATRQS